MKKFAERVQRLSQKAAEIRQAAESVPPKVQEIRDALTATASQVQKARADIFSSVSALRASDDEQLLKTLREIDASSALLEEAGFRLTGVDMDLGANRRLIVQLDRVEDIATEDIRALQKANAHRSVPHALLEALVRADELATKVDLANLRYAQMFIDVGPVPSVRVGWRSEAPRRAAFATTPLAAATTTPTNATTLATPFASSSFFEQRTTPLTIAATPVIEPITIGAAPSVLRSTIPSLVAEVTAPVEKIASVPEVPRSSALDRFKKMPDLTKRSQGSGSFR